MFAGLTSEDSLDASSDSDSSSEDSSSEDDSTYKYRRGGGLSMHLLFR